jgi:putative ATPase
MDLFDHAVQETIRQEAPLAARMRPRNLDEFVGQENIIGPGKLLRRAIEADRLFSSLIFFGPPGTGKTTLAQVIANHTQAHFESISAVLVGVPELRKVIAEAQQRRKMFKKRTILFVDEVHRWNKAQQDALLPHVETGQIVLIGATTENPYFDVISALVSRSRVFELHPLTRENMETILERALSDTERGYGSKKIAVDPEARDHLIGISNGDARNLLNALELAVGSTPPQENGTIHITLAVAEESIQQRAVVYDKNGDAHYDTISAFIKSVRGSDPDAALYWLGKMLVAGENPRFILRRLIVLASEDIGLADPQGMVVAAAAANAFEYIGMPEGIYPITEATLYLATAPKSNSAGAIFKAQDFINEHGLGAVPTHLMDDNRDAKGLGHGKGYQYPHIFPGHFTPQQYLPDEVMGVHFYEPSNEGYEQRIAERLAAWRKTQSAKFNPTPKENDGDSAAHPTR